MGFVVNGKLETVPGLQCTSYLENSALPRLRTNAPADGRGRTTLWVRGIVLHTTKGIPGGKDQRPQVILTSPAPAGTHDERIARFWSTQPKQSGAPLVIDFDNSMVCLADLLLDAAYHAGAVNDVSIGIEIYQGSQAEMYHSQLERVVQLIDWLTRRFGIQRQIPDRYRGPLTRLEAGGRDLVGVYGHRDVTPTRGAGDPGDTIFQMLADAGYERFGFDNGADRAVWRARQSRFRELHVDGIPGPATVKALSQAGYKHGMWIARPGD